MLDICILFSFFLVHVVTTPHDSHQMIALGSIIQVLSMLMLSLAHRNQYYQAGPNITYHEIDPEPFLQVFLAQAVGIGLGQSLLFLPSLTIIGHHFKCRRALATGIAVSVSLIDISLILPEATIR